MECNALPALQHSRVTEFRSILEPTVPLVGAPYGYNTRHTHTTVTAEPSHVRHDRESPSIHGDKPVSSKGSGEKETKDDQGRPAGFARVAFMVAQKKAL